MRKSSCDRLPDLIWGGSGFLLNRVWLSAVKPAQLPLKWNGSQSDQNLNRDSNVVMWAYTGLSDKAEVAHTHAHTQCCDTTLRLIVLRWPVISLWITKAEKNTKGTLAFDWYVAYGGVFRQNLFCLSKYLVFKPCFILLLFLGTVTNHSALSRNGVEGAALDMYLSPGNVDTAYLYNLSQIGYINWH